MLADPYDRLLDLLADLLVEDLAAEANGAPKKAKGAKPGTARPSQSSQRHHQERRDDTARQARNATSA
jgi:hypothetical protein